MSWLEGYPADVVAFVNEPATGARVLVITNFGPGPVTVPPGTTVLVSSGPLTTLGTVPTDTTVWLTDRP